jgi:uncharacterized membrane protein (DUF4010 family)
MTVVGVVLAYLLVRKNTTRGKDVKMKDPFRIIPALTFGAFFALVLLISKLAGIYFGDAGIYAASIVSGLADVDAITLTLSTLAKSTLSPNVAVASITIAAITNTLVKLCIAYVLGTREFGNRIAAIFLPTVLTGLIALFLF